MDYSVDYNDDRFKQVEQQQNDAITKSNDLYNNMIEQNNKYYQDLIDNANQWRDTQTDIQNQKTEQTINEINQQKEWATKDYEKEQKGAYASYQKNLLGQEDAMARAGISSNGGLSETAKIASWSAYQSRYASARETYQKAIQNYDNSITNARLQNNATIAEIAYNTLQQTLELSLEGFQYKNQLLQTQLENEQALNNTYYERYQDVLNQINNENALKEEARQYNENMAYQRERDAIEDARYEQALKSSYSSSGGSGGYTSYSYGGSESEANGISGYFEGAKSENVNPYTNTINKDAQYGTFSNGYQPNNYGGVALTKTSYKVGETALAGSKNSGGKSMDSQAIWTCNYGGKQIYLVWDGYANGYKKVTASEINGKKVSGDNKLATGGTNENGKIKIDGVAKA